LAVFSWQIWGRKKGVWRLASVAGWLAGDKKRMTLRKSRRPMIVNQSVSERETKTTTTTTTTNVALD